MSTLTIVQVRHDGTDWVTRSIRHPLTQAGALAAVTALLTQEPDSDGWRVSSLAASR